jgi:hypothetical protein
MKLESVKASRLLTDRKLVVALGVLIVLLSGIQYYTGLSQRSEWDSRLATQRGVIAKLKDEATLERESAALLSAANARLSETVKRLNADCVSRESVRFIDDIPTVSMREKCLGFALAWRDILPEIARMKKSLELSK